MIRCFFLIFFLVRNCDGCHFVLPQFLFVNPQERCLLNSFVDPVFVKIWSRLQPFKDMRNIWRKYIFFSRG